MQPDIQRPANPLQILPAPRLGTPEYAVVATVDHAGGRNTVQRMAGRPVAVLLLPLRHIALSKFAQGGGNLMLHNILSVFWGGIPSRTVAPAQRRDACPQLRDTAWRW